MIEVTQEFIDMLNRSMLSYTINKSISSFLRRLSLMTAFLSILSLEKGESLVLVISMKFKHVSKRSVLTCHFQCLSAVPISCFLFQGGKSEESSRNLGCCASQAWIRASFTIVWCFFLPETPVSVKIELWRGWWMYQKMVDGHSAGSWRFSQSDEMRVHRNKDVVATAKDSGIHMCNIILVPTHWF